MYYVYAIKSRTKVYIYVGLTNNVKRRLDQHNKGRAKTTKPYRPFDLKYLKKFSTREEARKAEKKLKSGYGKEYLKSLKLNNAGMVELVDTLDLKSSGS